MENYYEVKLVTGTFNGFRFAFIPNTDLLSREQETWSLSLFSFVSITLCPGVMMMYICDLIFTFVLFYLSHPVSSHWEKGVFPVML